MEKQEKKVKCCKCGKLTANPASELTSDKILFYCEEHNPNKAQTETEALTEAKSLIMKQAEAIKEATETIETLETINEIQGKQLEDFEEFRETTDKTIKADGDRIKQLEQLTAMLMKELSFMETAQQETQATANKYKRLYLEGLNNLDETVKEIDILREHADSLRKRTHSRKINLKNKGE